MVGSKVAQGRYQPVAPAAERVVAINQFGFFLAHIAAFPQLLICVETFVSVTPNVASSAAVSIAMPSLPILAKALVLVS